MLKPFAGCILMGISVWLIDNMIVYSLNIVLRVLVDVISGILIYVFVELILKADEIQVFKNFIFKFKKS